MLKVKKGFTLVELVLSLVLIAGITAFSVPVFQRLLVASDLNASTDMLVHSLRRAQNLSRSVKYDESWGVKLIDDRIIIFAGDDYLSRDVALDEVYDYSEAINFTGDDEFVFSKLSGELATSGSVSLVNSFGVNVVDVSVFGRIDY